MSTILSCGPGGRRSQRSGGHVVQSTLEESKPPAEATYTHRIKRARRGFSGARDKVSLGEENALDILLNVGTLESRRKNSCRNLKF